MRERGFCFVWMVCLGAGLGSAQVKDGFLQFGWGTEIAEVQREITLKPVSTIEQTTTYTALLPDLDGVELADCMLEFHGGRLAGVIVTTQGHDNSSRFLALLKRYFGDGKQESPRGYQWFSPRTHVAYDEDSAGDAYIYWYSLQETTGETLRPRKGAR